ncbi:hypothetical protein GOP47_0009398 [Adiantum capillus-veneris]|uniref:Uncharacterized protein n=1 Tax=Adiantum capillus-veneris TaxID=13818 RepID=A0A9D4ZIN6_ADICA|nr:hypothetical protein GOP47_0009398 [Adiantum capillus-veneris]
MNLYRNIVTDMYDERVKSTLEEYDQCMESKGKDFTWDIFNTSFLKIPSNYASQFSTSRENIERSFNILNLHKNETTSKIWFPCAIRAVANLTTPGIRVTILVQRYRT